MVDKRFKKDCYEIYKETKVILMLKLFNLFLDDNVYEEISSICNLSNKRAVQILLDHLRLENKEGKWQGFVDALKKEGLCRVLQAVFFCFVFKRMVI